MELKIEKTDLLNLLGKTQSIVEKKNAMPILVNVLLQAQDGKLKIFATDLEVSLTDEANADIKVAGQVAVDAKNLFSIVKELADGPVLLKKKENNWLEIKQSKSVFNIVGIAAEEFPVFPTHAAHDPFKINASTFRDMIEKTIYSVSTDETRYHLNGVYFEQLKTDAGVKYRAVATDGHRLSVVEREVPENRNITQTTDVIIPRKGLNEVRKLLESLGEDLVEIAIEGPQFIFRNKGTTLMVRLIEGRYPNYQQLIPQRLKNSVQTSRENLISSLKRVSLLSNQKSKGVTLAFSKGAMKITSNNPELGDAKEELEIDYSGEEFKIGFNARYILDILNSIEDENIKIELNDQLSPGMIRPGGDTHYKCVIMPMRI